MIYSKGASMKKQLLSISLSVLVVSSLLSGCGKKEDSSDLSESQSITASDSETTLSEGFDWETVKQDITLDGRKIDVPFSVNDLGEGYKISSVNDDLFGENSCYGTVEKQDGYNSASVCMVFFDGIKSDSYNNDVKCTRISFADTLTVSGIGAGSAMKDAEKIFGNPYMSDDSAKYFLSKSGKERIEIYYDSETDKVKEIQLNLNFNENE